MKKNNMLFCILIGSFSLFSMDDTKIAHPIEIPDITRLIAYSLVNVSIKTPEKLLSSLIAFSFITKKVRKVIYPLINEWDAETRKYSKDCGTFNEYAQLHIQNHLAKTAALKNSFFLSPRCLAAAYIGTPYALTMVKQEYEQSTNIEEFQEKLNTKYITKELDYFAESLLMAPIKPIEPERFDETLKKFPSSTRNFCKKLIQEKPKK